MNPAEINIQIAKSLGYYQCPIALAQQFKPHESWRRPNTWGARSLPDYVNSHDAMDEALASLKTSEQQMAYIDNLCSQMGTRFLWNSLTATPLQKATAYINTICPSITAQNHQDVSANSPKQSTPIPPGSANAALGSMNTAGT